MRSRHQDKDQDELGLTDACQDLCLWIGMSRTW